MVDNEREWIIEDSTPLWGFARKDGTHGVKCRLRIKALRAEQGKPDELCVTVSGDRARRWAIEGENNPKGKIVRVAYEIRAFDIPNFHTPDGDVIHCFGNDVYALDIYEVNN